MGHDARANKHPSTCPISFNRIQLRTLHTLVSIADIVHHADNAHGRVHVPTNEHNVHSVRIVGKCEQVRAAQTMFTACALCAMVTMVYIVCSVDTPGTGMRLDSYGYCDMIGLYKDCRGDDNEQRA